MAKGRHRLLRGVRNYVIGLVATVVAVVIVLVAVLEYDNASNKREIDKQQAKLAPFYSAPRGWEHAELGAVLRSERVKNIPGNHKGWRVLYRSERADGAPSVSGGLVFVPNAAAPAGGRPVLAWAHGTAGMGDECAPSRSPTPGKGIPGLANFLSAGWVVVATDYSGLGTAGTLQYLVGEAEARDVLYSIRAARAMPDTHASARVALWGHSQGGQSVLWTEHLVRELTPELQLVAAAAAAPAAELAILMDHQWDNVGGSLIASEALVGWPETYSNVEADQVWNKHAGSYRSVAQKCIEAGLIDLELRNIIGRGQLLKVNPMTVPSWRRAVEANIAPLPLEVPTFIAQGLADPLVLPGSTATFVTSACQAGANLTADFIGDLGHMKAGFAAAPAVFTWLQQRLAGVPNTSTCATLLPVAPLER